MLNLDVIFDPERIEQTVAMRFGLKAATSDAAGPTSPLPCINGAGPEDLPMDWRIAWEERAAIMEYDGCLPRERAEVDALADVLRTMAREGLGYGNE